MPALAALLAIGACGVGGRDGPRDGLEPHTARFTYGDRSVEVPLDACARDGDVVLAAGASGSIVLQVAADLGEGGLDRSAVTGDVPGDGIFGAFGADLEHGPAGEITHVAVSGDRLTVEGTWVAFDGELRPQPATTLEGRVVARCPADDELAGRAQLSSSAPVASSTWSS